MKEQILAVQRMQDHIEAHLEEDYAQAILAVEQAMNRYAPTFIGYQWNDGDPEPRGQRGYIELRAVRPL